MPLPSYEELAGSTSLPSYDELARQPSFDTTVPFERVPEFEQWIKRYAPPQDSGDYDYGGAFLAGVLPDSKGHWPDTFKKPNHPTFSDESQYAKDAPERAGHWDGEAFAPHGALPSYDELTQNVPDEIAQSEAQQEMERNATAPDWANRAANAVMNTAKGFVPRSLHDVAGLATPVTGSIDEMVKDYRIGRDVLTTPASLEEATRKYAPERFQLVEAEKTPALSQERFQAASDIIAQMLMMKGIAKGLKGGFKAGEVPKPDVSAAPNPEPQEQTTVQGQMPVSGESLAREPQEMVREGPPSAADARGLPVSRPVTQRFVQPEGAPVIPESETTAGITRDALAWRSGLLQEGQQLGEQLRVMRGMGQPIPKPLADRIAEINNELARGFRPQQQPQYELRGEAPLEEELPPERIKRPEQSATGEPNALRQRSTETEIPSPIERGENQQVSGERVRPSEQGQEVAGTSQTPEESQVPLASSDDPFVSRIANRFSQERATRGEIGEVAPGQGYATADLVNRGLRMSPEEINQHVSDIMRNEGNNPVAQAAAIRAEEARLSDRSTELSRVAESNPTNLAAQHAANSAFQDLTDFHNGPVAKLKQRFHASGMALQREIPVDLSTFNGLREDWLKNNDRPPPSSMDPTFKRTARNVSRAVTEERAATNRLGQEIERATRGRKLPSPDEVRNAIRERMGLGPCRV